jgi:hypothetical protein
MAPGTPTEPALPGRGVARDQRGAVLLFGLFAAMLLVAVIHYLLGIGDAIRRGERLQDAADSGVFSMAVMHARAMNLVAMINMVHMSVLAILAALGATIVAGLETMWWISRSRRRRWRYFPSFFVLGIVVGGAVDRYWAVSGKADAILDAGRSLQRALRDDLPEIAELHARAMVTREFGPPGPPVEAFFAHPLAPLAIEQGGAAERLHMCRRAQPHAVTISDNAFRRVPQRRPRNRARDTARKRMLDMCLAEATFRGVTPPRLASERIGSEPFQLRAYALGEPPNPAGERGVKLAAYGRDGEDPLRERRQVLTRVSFAQAEYYFVGPSRLSAPPHIGIDPGTEKLWHMTWTARLRRFRPQGFFGLDRACAAAGGDQEICWRLPAFLEGVDDAVVH